jgi:hypothetical protein
MASVSSRSRLPPARHLPALRRALLAWHRTHGLRAPWRASGDAYEVLVAAVMAQQTQMSRVLPKFDEFVAAFPTVEALAHAPAGEVLRRWAPLGYNLRALRLHRAAKLIVRRGGFPRAAAELERIEGIGPFTAAIIARRRTAHVTARARALEPGDDGPGRPGLHVALAEVRCVPAGALVPLAPVLRDETRRRDASALSSATAVPRLAPLLPRAHRASVTRAAAARVALATGA